jgi:N-methylhydantoinase B/oxoprolinase/acetone carboxylase alpha subunit
MSQRSDPEKGSQRIIGSFINSTVVNGAWSGQRGALDRWRLVITVRRSWIQYANKRISDRGAAVAGSQHGFDLLRKLLKRYGFSPNRFVTDELRSYSAAARADTAY